MATPWRARTGEVAVSSQANPHWSIEAGREQLYRLGCVVFGLTVVTAIMLVL